MAVILNARVMCDGWIETHNPSGCYATFEGSIRIGYVNTDLNELAKARKWRRIKSRFRTMPMYICPECQAKVKATKQQEQPQ